MGTMKFELNDIVRHNQDDPENYRIGRVVWVSYTMVDVDFEGVGEVSVSPDILTLLSREV